MAKTTPAPRLKAKDTTVDLLVVGTGTGMLAALAGKDAGLNVLMVEASKHVGGSTGLSGGAFWIPANSVIREAGGYDSKDAAKTYLDSLVGDDAPKARRDAYVDEGPRAVELMKKMTPMEFMWCKGYSDYHPEHPGGSATGRTCETKPFDLKTHLGEYRDWFIPPNIGAPIPMPITGADYKWMNLMAKEPVKAFPRIIKRVTQGVGGMVIGREYSATGQATAGGLFAGVVKAGIPVWTETKIVRLVTEGDRVTGAVVEQDGTEYTVTATKGVIISTGGFDHNMAKRHEHQSEHLEEWTHGAPENKGGGIQVGVEAGADTALLDQAWWFPSIAPIGDAKPTVMLAERSLPGSIMVGANGKRFINECIDYMTFGQNWIERVESGDPIGDMWIVFDQEYKNSYVFGTVSYPRTPLPQAWYDAGIAVTAETAEELAGKMGVPADALADQIERFNKDAALGYDREFGRGDSRYDNYYGDPTITPNPNLRPLKGTLYAVRVVNADLGTCGGLVADEKARVLRPDGSVIEGLYAIGNAAANAFGKTYPGAGATIGQGLVFGMIAAEHAAGK